MQDEKHFDHQLTHMDRKTCHCMKIVCQASGKVGHGWKGNMFRSR